MYVVFEEKESQLSAYAEADDLCYNCKNAFYCPVYALLTSEYMILRYESVNICECGLFKSKDSQGEDDEDIFWYY